MRSIRDAENYMRQASNVSTRLAGEVLALHMCRAHAVPPGRRDATLSGRQVLEMCETMPGTCCRWC